MSNKRGGTNRGEVGEFYGQFLGGLQANPALERERAIERMYIRVLSELAMNRFIWQGLPNTVDPRFLELTLYRYALAVFYDDPRFGWVALQGTPAGHINAMQNPTAFQITGPNFEGRTVSAKSSAPIWANYLRTPDLDIVRIYANRLANFDRTLEINSSNARQTRLVKANANQRLTMRNVSRQMDEGVPVIEYNSNAIGDMGDQIEVLDLGVDAKVIEQLDIIATRQWNKCMGLLGIEFANQDKKERLVADEVDANNEQTDNMKFVNLNARRQAAKKMSELYGAEITVAYNTEVEAQAKQVFNIMLEEATSGSNNDTETDSDNDQP